jgi:hypothetical protein
MKFGKLAPKHNSKGLLLNKYLAASIPPAPEKVYREYKVPASLWGMLGNDTLGDCTCAAIAHYLMLVTAHTGAMLVPTVEDVVTVYSAVSGYDPATGANDNGAAITDVLEYWRTTGIAGHKILAWAALDQTNLAELRQAIWLFGGIDIGVQLPNVAVNQFNAGQPWEVVTDDGGLDGGHSVPNFGYGSEGTNCITWAQRQGMSWDWFQKYCDEAYTVITPEWFQQATQKTPSGFDLAALQADLLALKAQ